MKLTAESTVLDDKKIGDSFAILQVEADGIRTEVGTKVGNNEVISRINQTPEIITIHADKVDIEGTIRAINNNTTTTIDGDKIATGTLSARAVDAESGEFNTANIPNLSAEKITTGTIHIERIPATARNDTYITDIGDDGIRVHDSHTSNNSVVINSGGMKVYKGGTADANCIAEYSDIIRIGKAASNHISIDTTDGIQVFIDSTNKIAQFGSSISLASNGATVTIGKVAASNYNAYITTSNFQIRNNTTPIATFGSSISLGSDGATVIVGQVATDKYNAYITPSGFSIRNNTTPVATFGSSISLASNGATVTIGKVAENNYNTYITSSNFQIRNNTTPIATFGSSVTLASNGATVTIGKTGTNNTYNTVISSAGMSVNNNATSVAEFGTTIRIGKTGTNNRNVYITNEALQIRNNTTVLAEYGDNIRIGKDTSIHTVISDTQFAMLSNQDEPYFSISHVGKTRENQMYWQNKAVAKGSTDIIGIFPKKNSSDVTIGIEDDLGGSVLYFKRSNEKISNSNVKKTGGYSITYSVTESEHLSGSITIQCINSPTSPYITLTATNNVTPSYDSWTPRIFMGYSRTTYIPELTFTGDNKILWQGGLQMDEMDEIILNEPISQQLTGIALVWAKDDDTAPNVQFVPKTLVYLNPTGNVNGVAVNQVVAQSNFDNIGVKTVYITDTRITGHQNNILTSGTKSSISPVRSGYWYLTYVFGI